MIPVGRRTVEIEAPLDSLPLKINGDDCVFKTTRAGYDTWLRVAAAAGMKSSIGKTYVGRHWFQINSQIFSVRDGVYSKVAYANLGLLTPVSPKGSDERTWRDLPSLCQKFLEGFSTPKGRDLALRWFLNDHSQLLAQVPRGMSYWLPQHLGGLGLPRTPSLERGILLRPSSIVTGKPSRNF